MSAQEEGPEEEFVGFVAEEASEVLKEAVNSATAVAGGSISIASSSPGRLTVSPHSGGYVTGPMGPPGPPGPMGPPGIATTGTFPVLYTNEEEAKEKAEREADLVVLPPRRPRKVLVAFFDDEDEDVNGEPFWAAFLEPEDMDLFLSPKDARDARMQLSLALRKRFAQ
ncbi:MAG: hypothetical protein AB7G23_21400 [Vicinamibacterales bacterium]